MNKNTFVMITLVVILMIGAVLRFYGIFERGLFIADETIHYRTALSAKAEIEKYLNAPRGSFLVPLRPVADAFAGKPLHVLLGVLSLFIFGVHQYSPIIMSASCGCLTLCLVFMTGKMLYSDKAGLIGAMLLAVSPFHVFYSRSYMAHADQALVITLAVFLYLLFYVKKVRGVWALGLVGFLLGCAFTIHATSLFYIIIFILFETLAWTTKRPRSFKNLSARLFTMTFFFSLPPLIFLLISIFGRAEPAPLFTFIHKGYFGQICFLENSGAIEEGVTGNKNFGNWHLIKLSGIYNGWIFTCGMVAASVFFLHKYVVRRRDLASLLLFILSSGVLIYWQFFAPYERQYRLTLVTYPFFCVIMGAVLSGLYTGKAVKVVILLLFIEGIYFSVPVITEVKSNFVELENYLNMAGAAKVLTTSYYIATTADIVMPSLVSRVRGVSNFTEIKSETKNGVCTYLIVDPDTWINNEEFHFKTKPKLLVRDQFFYYYPVFYESSQYRGRNDYLKYKNDPYARNMAVYDVGELLLEKKTN